MASAWGTHASRQVTHTSTIVRKATECWSGATLVQSQHGRIL